MSDSYNYYNPTYTMERKSQLQGCRSANVIYNYGFEFELQHWINAEQKRRKRTTSVPDLYGTCDYIYIQALECLIMLQVALMDITLCN